MYTGALMGGNDYQNADTLMKGGDAGNIPDSALGTIIHNEDQFGPAAAAAARAEQARRDAARAEGNRKENFVNNAQGGYDANRFNYGGDPNGATNQYNDAVARAGMADQAAGTYANVAQDYRNQGNTAFGNALNAERRGAQAYEDTGLSLNEEMARGDQAGAVTLSREAAMGLAPSQAAYQLQAGLDQASNQQLSQAASARGLGAMAVAGGNAAGAIGNLQQNAFTEAGRLRAQEMAEARGMYGSLSGQMRGADQQRLNMGNQMGQYNAGLNEQYGQRMGQLYGQAGQLGASNGQLGLGYSQLGQGYYGQGLGVQSDQLKANQNQQAIAASSYENQQARQQHRADTGMAQSNRAEDKQDAEDARTGEAIGGVAATAAKAIPSFIK